MQHEVFTWASATTMVIRSLRGRSLYCTGAANVGMMTRTAHYVVCLVEWLGRMSDEHSLSSWKIGKVTRPTHLHG